MKQIILCALAVATWTGSVAVGHAQSPYNYSWCAVYPGKFGARSCYYNSYEQCIARMRGIGGFCSQNPAYQGPAPGATQTRSKRRASSS